MMKEYRQNDIPFFRFDSMAENGHISHAIFTRIGGVSRAPYDSLNLSLSVPDDHPNVLANRERAYATHGRTNESLVHAYLTHGADAVAVSQDDYGHYVGPVDGLITNQKGCGLTMNYADCAPIILYDPVKGAIGLGHAGWQGTVKDLPGALVRALQQAFGTNPADLVAGVGPCIGPCCYEVGTVVTTAVRQTFEKPDSLLISLGEDGLNSGIEERRFFDLPEANRHRLLASGVKQVELSGLCTACRTDLFFSHRAEKGRTGRFGALILLE